MHLVGLRLVGVGPFDDLVLPFADDDGDPRLLTVIQGVGGVGKTTVLAALAATRPGHAVAGLPGPTGEAGRGVVIASYRLGQDDPERPHPLHVATPTARVFEDDDAELLRRREQALFERLAHEGGYVFVSIGAARWFSRQPLVLSAPGRTLARYDVRSSATTDDATRADLARETKQALVYAALAGALADGRPLHRRFQLLARAMDEAVEAVLATVMVHYGGVDPLTLEPFFVTGEGSTVPFDGLPTCVRHLVAFVALPVRALWAAYPARDPREAEGVVTIDEVDLHQDSTSLSRLASALPQALPRVQWILTATSSVLAASVESHQVLALRRSSEPAGVELFTGRQALTH
ncbi:MAG: hypothetical protein JW751_16980 [Polyangiaceae bacterium]|nr:hypothetical protein [Polyangiaceae bacterium]